MRRTKTGVAARSIAGAFVLALLSAGCTPAVWVRPDTTSAQFERDKQECWYDAEKATASNENMFAGLLTQDLAMKCLRLRGYSQQRK